MNISRRTLIKSISAVLISSYCGASSATPLRLKNKAFLQKIIEIEKQLNARVGVAVIDTETQQHFVHREHERFPLCSTFKFLAVSAVLARVDAGKEEMNRRIIFQQQDIVSFSPVTETHLEGGMTLAELCEAALTRSDNTAGNLILNSLGGPAALTHFARGLGDKVTRLDRMETALNEATPGDPRDTSSPLAMAKNLRSLLLGDSLSESSRAQLKRWMVANKTGDARLRAGVPKDWLVADKTGSGDYGSTNDVAVLWPPGRKPLVVSAYITETKAVIDQCNNALASIARALQSTDF